MRSRFLSKLLPRMKRFSGPMVAAGSFAALVLALLAGFVPGREGGEVRMPLQFTGPDPLRLYAPRRPLDTSTWMVRLPLQNDTLPQSTYREATDSESLIGFDDGNVMMLTVEGPRTLVLSGGQYDVFHELNRKTRGLPVGLTLDNTGSVNGVAMPWCSPLVGQPRMVSAVRKAWSSRTVLPYGEIVKRYAERFNLDTSLVYAIMYTESGFNPKAISRRYAHGLMQIVPSTAGGEVYRYLNGYHGTPRASDLLDPEINIQYGTTYLHLLMCRHFDGVRDPLSREYCAIAAYNSGSGNVLKVFGSTREEAFDTINSYTPVQVYDILHQRLPSPESRNFIRKVLTLRDGIAVAAR